MPRAFARFEDDCPAVLRKYLNVSSILVKPSVSVELKVPAPLATPFSIQENDEIQSTVPLANRVVVEVDVVMEALTGEVLMSPTAEVLRIKEQIGESGDIRDRVEELSCLDDLMEFALRR